MGAGSRKVRCLFQREKAVRDGLGNETDGDWLRLCELWGDLDERPGREPFEAGRLQSEVPAILTLRAVASARKITEADRVRIQCRVFNIRSIHEPHRSGEIIMSLQRGVAV